MVGWQHGWQPAFRRFLFRGTDSWCSVAKTRCPHAVHGLRFLSALFGVTLSAWLCLLESLAVCDHERQPWVD